MTGVQTCALPIALLGLRPRNKENSSHMVLRFFHNMLRNKVTRHSGAISIQHSRLSTCFEIKSPDTRGLYRYSIVVHNMLRNKVTRYSGAISIQHSRSYICFETKVTRYSSDFDKNSKATRLRLYML